MQTVELQRKLEHYSRKFAARFEQLRLGTTLQEIEALRERKGGVFGHRTGHRWQAKRGKWLWEPTSEWAFDRNIVTNEGLAYFIDVAFDNATDIDTFYLVLSTTNTTPLATHTYASPGFTEATTTNLDEATRQAWVEGAGSGTTTRSIDNAASPAVYTGDDSFTAYGAALKGGGSAPTTISDTAGGGSMPCYSLFASSKAMTVDDTIEVTYTVTATDDGV